jgi:cell cycle checkpoint protein
MPADTQRILLVTGPAGIGKTTTVRLLARSLGIDLVEWTDSVDERGLGGYGARFFPYGS